MGRARNRGPFLALEHPGRVRKALIYSASRAVASSTVARACRSMRTALEAPGDVGGLRSGRVVCFAISPREDHGPTSRRLRPAFGDSRRFLPCRARGRLRIAGAGCGRGPAGRGGGLANELGGLLPTAERSIFLGSRTTWQGSGRQGFKGRCGWLFWRSDHEGAGRSRVLFFPSSSCLYISTLGTRAPCARDGFGLEDVLRRNCAGREQGTKKASALGPRVDTVWARIRRARGEGSCRRERSSRTFIYFDHSAH